MTIIKAGKARGNRKQRTIVRLEKWAEGCGAKLQPIEVQATRSADYKVTFPDDEQTTIIVEVKEIGFDFEVKLTEGSPVIELPESGPGEGRFRSADRVRHKIRKSAKQLQPYADKLLPTLLLVGVSNPVIDRSVFLPLDIPIAMRGGGPAIVLGDSGMTIQSTARGGARATGEFNRSILAIGRLECLEERLARDADSPERIIVYRHDNPKVSFPSDLPGISVAM
jgi:hypothetical protein